MPDETLYYQFHYKQGLIEDKDMSRIMSLLHIFILTFISRRAKINRN